MTTLSNRLEKNWRNIIRSEFDIGDEFDYVAMEQFLQKERAKGKIYPKDEEIFNALNLTPFKKIKVVIIGQDPYPGKGQAHGLCFSTKGENIPRSLKNIYKECGIEKPFHGDLTKWAAQGALLLNATLTVREGIPRSHEGKGWEKFTDAVIRAVNKKPGPVVFMLWGRRAQEKRALIDKKHKVLEASHPSGFSAHRGYFRDGDGEIHSFLGCGHFKKANDYLEKHELKPIDWHEI
ncbi:MAG: uracil-DNA glycosylase [Candidatus Sulfotelmatobacter sp.]